MEGSKIMAQSATNINEEWCIGVCGSKTLFGWEEIEPFFATLETSDGHESIESLLLLWN